MVLEEACLLKKYARQPRGDGQGQSLVDLATGANVGRIGREGDGGGWERLWAERVRPLTSSEVDGDGQGRPQADSALGAALGPKAWPRDDSVLAGSVRG